MSGEVLSRAEVEEISRSQIRARQLAFLCQNGIPHHVDEYNRVIVLRKAAGAPVTPIRPGWHGVPTRRYEMSEKLCLTREEIKALARTPLKVRQLAFLHQNGIRHYIDG